MSAVHVSSLYQIILWVSSFYNVFEAFFLKAWKLLFSKIIFKFLRSVFKAFLKKGWKL